MTGPRSIEVDGESRQADRIFLNVGARSRVPDITGLDEVDYLTNRGMLELEELPDHLVVVGGSYIGLEFGQMFRRFGSDVTIVEQGPRVVARESADISDEITGILDREGIEVETGAECFAVEPHNQGVAVRIDREGGPETVVGSHLLLATGRVPNTDDLGLEEAGVETDGLLKVFVDADTEQVLGATVLGIAGDEVIHSILTLMYTEASYRTMLDAVHIHPTVSELLPTLLDGLESLEG